MQCLSTVLFENVCERFTLAYIILAVLAFSIVLITWLNSRLFDSQILWTIRRWIRAGFVSVSIFILVSILFEKNSYFTLALSLLIYFFAESLILWIKVCKYSSENIIPFADFKEVPNAWRSDRKSLVLKNKIEKLNFKKQSSFHNEKAQQYLTVFFSEENKIFLLVSFTKKIASIDSFFAFVSQEKSGSFFITNNSSSSFAFVLPKSVKIKYVPFRRSICKLLESHNRFLEKHDFKNAIAQNLDAFTLQKISDIIYKENILKNIMHNKSSAESYGLLTTEGKYRFWKKTFFANYFLRPF